MREIFIHRVFKYLRDKLSDSERHAFEKDVIGDPFLQDAMDGFGKLSVNDLEYDLNKLEQRLISRSENKTRRLIPYIKIAASIAIIIGIGVTAIYISNNYSYTDKLAEESSSKKQEKIEQKVIKEKIIEKDIEESKEVEISGLIKEINQTKNTSTPQQQPKMAAKKMANKNTQRKENETAELPIQKQTIILKEEFSNSYEEPIMKAKPIAAISSENVHDTTIFEELHLKGEMTGAAIKNDMISSGANNNVIIRGTGSIKDSSPLYIVDGIEAESIENISPSDVKSIDVLKDESAAAIYGSRANNGVVMVKTKKASKKSSKNANLNMINGQIVDDSNLPLPGAMVTIDGTDVGTISDINGYFSIKADSNEQLNIVFIGYEEVKLTAYKLQALNNTIQLRANELALEEVVVVGYGTKKKSNATGAVSRISASDISPHNKQTPEYIKKFKPKKVSITYKSNADVAAEPKDGIKKFEKYIKNNFRYESLKATKIVVYFFVETDGSISNITVSESPNEKYTNEIIQLLNNYSKWKPSIIDGEKIREIVTVTILFR